MAPFSAATFGLMPRHDCTVAGDHDCALDGDAVAVEDLVVLRTSVVHVDKRRRHIAVARVHVVGRQLLALLRRGGILRQDGLIQPGGVSRRFQQLDDALLRSREQHVERFYLGLPAERTELGGQPLRVVLVVGRTDVMGPGAQAPHRLLHGGGLRQRAILFGPGRCRALRRLCGGRDGKKNGSSENGEYATTGHQASRPGSSGLILSRRAELALTGRQDETAGGATVRLLSISRRVCSMAHQSLC